MSTKRRLFNDKSIKRILDNLFHDNQIGFDLLRWMLIKSYFGILVYAPSEFVRVMAELFPKTPLSELISALDDAGILNKIAPKAGAGSTIRRD